MGFLKELLAKRLRRMDLRPGGPIIGRTVGYLLRSAILSRFDWERAQTLPPTVQIENTNACNVRCVMCPRGEMHRHVGFIDMTLFRKIVDDMSDSGIDFLTLGGFGEPMLDCNFIEQLAYAAGKGIHVEVFTNATLLSEDIARALVEHRTAVVHLSIDAADEEMFRAVRQRGRLADVALNVQRLRSVRDEAQTEVPHMIAGIHSMRLTGGHIAAFRRRWQRVADRISVSPIHQWTLRMDERNTELGLLPSASVRAPCMRLWSAMSVLWTGEVSVCCSDFDGELILGDLRTSSIAQVWRGTRYVRARQGHLSANLSATSVCQRCTQWQYAPSVQPWWWPAFVEQKVK